MQRQLGLLLKIFRDRYVAWIRQCDPIAVFQLQKTYLQSTPELLGIRNLANDWNPKTRNPESVIWNSEPTLRNPETKTAHAIPSILGKIKARSEAQWVIKFGYPCMHPRNFGRNKIVSPHVILVCPFISGTLRSNDAGGKENVKKQQ